VVYKFLVGQPYDVILRFYLYSFFYYLNQAGLFLSFTISLNLNITILSLLTFGWLKNLMGIFGISPLFLSSSSFCSSAFTFLIVLRKKKKKGFWFLQDFLTIFSSLTPTILKDDFFYQIHPQIARFVSFLSFSSHALHFSSSSPPSVCRTPEKERERIREREREQTEKKKKKTVVKPKRDSGHKL
jgi:hypothetical protein